MSSFLLGPDPDSESDQDDSLRYAPCELPDDGLTTAPTHVIMRVSDVTGLSREELKRLTTVGIGRKGMDYFLEGMPQSFATATVACVKSEDPSVKTVMRHREVTPRMPIDGRGDNAEVSWGSSPGEVRVRLRPGDISVRAALVVGSEVIGISDELDLRGPARRFFNVHQFYKSKNSVTSVAKPLGSVRLLLDLWPPGSWLKSPEDDEDDEESQDLPDKRACNFCDGLGRKPCDPCGTQGSLVCRTCDGMPTLACSTCSGTGNVQQGLEAIRRGGGRGASLGVVRGRRCTACWGAPVTCLSCFGAGSLRCATCRGAGWTPCSRCVPGRP